MVMLGAMVFAEADGHHLEQTALDGAAEIGVRFHPVDDADVIRLGGILVEPHRDAVGRLAELHHFHGGAERHTHALLGDAVVAQHIELPIGCAAAMAAHAGMTKGLAPIV